MGIEIERKFLVASEAWRDQVRRSAHYVQGYLAGGGAASVRVRVAGERAWVNIKSGALTITRREFDYPIPVEDARCLLEELCVRPAIEKTRHFVEHAGYTWEVDEYEGENTGLVLAELELTSPEAPFERPDWLGREVSDDPRYYSPSLVANPYSSWKDSA